MPQQAVVNINFNSNMVEFSKLPSANGFFIQLLCILTKEQGSLVSVVSDYGLDDQVTGVRSQVGGKGFSSSLCVQAGLGSTQPPIQWVTGVPSPGVKRSWGVMLTSHPHLVPR
jgi:hypothetical protein